MRVLNHAQVVIVGAGIAGITTARCLADRGVTDILIVDENDIATGSTSKAAGFVRAWHLDPVWRRLARRGWMLLQQWLQQLPDSPLCVEHPLLVVNQTPPAFWAGLQVAGPVNVAAMAAAYLRRKAQSWIKTGEVVDPLYPYSIGRDEEVIESSIWRIDPVTTTRVLADDLRQRGVRFQLGTRVFSWRTDRGHVDGLETTAGIIHCRSAVFACGPRIANVLGLQHLPVNVQRVPVARYWGSPPNRCPVLIDLVTPVYIAPETDSWLVSLPPELDTSATARSEITNPTCEESHRLAARALQRLSSLQGQDPYQMFVGHYDQSADGRPLAGPIPGVEGGFLITGLMGSGFQVSPAIADLLAAAIVGDRHGAQPLEELRVDRPELSGPTSDKDGPQ